jgi:acyl transferase domain-containing protein/NADPH:quinone reductase-like Zn-dependent oxidoreductase/NAD(P)-dependent dehydrogenase (short-subunit alcohol dehydrogenase family)/acyl carrier protein
MPSTDIPIADTAERDFPQQEPIAIVGIGCRYSGDINNLEDFWKMLIDKRSTLEDFPSDRFADAATLVDPERGYRKMVSRRGGWLHKLKEFDAQFFKISPREAEKVDPHQRLMLEVTFEAFEDAGIKPDDVWGSRTGVYAGMWSSDFEHVLANSKDDIDVYSTTGSGRYAAAGRLAYFFNLQGPTFTIDTACSTSLVAVHLAAQSLQLRETDLAVCSAANLILNPFISIGYSRSRLLSDYGKCRFGAVDASGYVRTEGAATVILKRLSDAERDGDHIHAIIPGSACNSDGQSHKYMLAPSAITQEIMIKDALKRARVAPVEVQYVEAHGTGTKAGDPAELASIPSALSAGRDPQDKFYVGSIKTNLGHTEAASGFAGMIKTILAIQNRTIPANLYADEDRNPNIPWGKIPVEIPAEAQPWPHPDRPLLAGVNSFGISGTNAHVLLKEAPASDKLPVYQRGLKMFPLSAANEKTLKLYAKAYLEDIHLLTSDQDILNYTVNVALRKADLQERAVILFNSKEELVSGLQAISQGEDAAQVLRGFSEERKGVALVFPGQGAQWSGMGKQLYHTEPVFKEAIDACEKAYAKYVSWVLTEELFSASGMQSIDVIQPALVAIEIALAKWWSAQGLVFQSVIGHSMGEVAAAYIAEKISLDEAACIICTRSALMKETSGEGAMGYIAISPEEVQKRMQDNEHLISIGVNNSPASVVISGAPSAVEKMLGDFDAEGFFARKIKVDVASHSPQMDPLLPRLSSALGHLHPVQSNVVFYSTVEAKILDAHDLLAEYWTANLRKTVRFAETIQLMAESGAGHFVEMSPHPTLLQAIQENADHLGIDLSVSGSLEREQDESRTLLKQFASYYCSGGRVNWKKFYGTDFKKILLPPYPFERKHYWVEEKTDQPVTIGLSAKAGTHPFLMQKTQMPEGSPVHLWDTQISLAQFPYLQDHKIHQTVVVPGAAYIEMFLAAAEEMAGPGQHVLKKVHLKRAMPVQDQQIVSVQIVLQHKIGDTFSGEIFSWEGDQEEGQWVCNASATLELNTQRARLLPNALPLDLITASTERKVSPEEHYHYTSEISLPYGPAFRTVDQLQIGENFIVADVNANARIAAGTERYLLHPAVLDGCIQAYLAAMYAEDDRGTFVPVSVGQIQLHEYGKSLKYLRAAIKITAESHNRITGNAVVYNTEGEVVLEMRDFSLDRLEQADTAETDDNLFYDISWIDTPLPESAQKRSLLFVDSDQHPLHDLLDPQFTVVPGSVYSKTGRLITLNPQSPGHYNQLLEDVGTEIDIVVHAWTASLQQLSAMDTQEHSALSAARMLKAFAHLEQPPRLWVITKSHTLYPAQALLPGMLHVWRNEHPEWKASSIELLDEDYTMAARIVLSNTIENGWQLREGSAAVARMQSVEVPRPQETVYHLVPADDQPFEAVIDEPGILDQIALRRKAFTNPRANEVRVEVKALGINFMNLMSALGIYPGKVNGFATLGIECAGVVTHIGDQVKHLAVGDRVMGMAYHTMASHVLVNADLLRPIPNGMSFEDAATIPVVYLTVYYSLVRLANLQPGERVLIHAATGGVGLAAIQVAQSIGAEIYATAGSESKRALLKQMGIRYVYNSRTTDFAAHIMQDTSGEGVDVVLNSLTGEAMLESLHLLRNFGRFVEIGKKDVYTDSKIGLQAFSKGLSYFMVDFEKMIFERPALVGQLLEEILKHVESGLWQPLEKKVFPISKAKEAFSFMSSGQHTGKIVVSVEKEEIMVEEPVHLAAIRPDVTYLLTGGYGGLGLTFAKYLVERGAKHLVLTGRSGPKEDALSVIQELEEAGVLVIVEQADVASMADVERVIREIPEDKPLAGVFHLAGLLEDASLLQLEEGAFYRVLQPKVAGAYHLHEATKELPLEHFVLFSSSTILFGSPGQAAYVAANSYLDALATFRKSLGLAALSIQWGTVSEVGLAAAAGNRADRLSEEGVAPLSPVECTALFERIAVSEATVMGAFRFDIHKWQSAYPTAATNPFFSQLRAASSEVSPAESVNATEASFVAELAGIADPELRMQAMEEMLREKVGLVVKQDPKEISTKTPFKSLGIDSLMSIQLKNQLEKAFETSLSVTSFWTYPNIREYVKFLAGKLQLDGQENLELKMEEQAVVLPIAAPATTEMPGEDLSLDDLSKLLEDELNDL